MGYLSKALALLLLLLLLLPSVMMLNSDPWTCSTLVTFYHGHSNNYKQAAASVL